MLHSLRTRLLAVEPPQVALTVWGRARVRVRGTAYGMLVVLARGVARFDRCAGERRWVFGAFDETFVVRRTSELTIRAFGLGGYAQRSVRFVPGPDLTGRTLPRSARLRWNAPRVPRLLPLSTQTIHALAKDPDHDRA